MTVSFEMVLPGLAGYWLDSRLGTKAIFTLFGCGLGMTWGIWHLLRMTGAAGAPSSGPRPRNQGGEDTEGSAKKS